MEPKIAGRTIAIGDIHGCVHALDALLAAINPTASDTIVCLGDFIDQGRDSASVLDALIDLEDRCRLVTLLGNHEEMLLGSIDNAKAREMWLMCGGVAMLNSYYFGAGMEVIPESHLEIIRRCEPYFETDDHIFVHANYDADLPLSEQPEYLLRWSLLDDPQPRPHMSGKTVICGHTEQRNGKILDLGCVKCIDTSCCSDGWLTGLDVHSGQFWQFSRFGIGRDTFNGNY